MCEAKINKKGSNIGKEKGWLVGQITWVRNGAVRVAEKLSTFLPCKEVWEEWGFAQPHEEEMNTKREMVEAGICVRLTFYAGALINVTVREIADDMKVTALEGIEKRRQNKKSGKG